MKKLVYSKLVKELDVFKLRSMMQLQVDKRGSKIQSFEETHRIELKLAHRLLAGRSKFGGPKLGRREVGSSRVRW